MVIRYECFGQNQLPRLRVIYIKKANKKDSKKSKIERRGTQEIKVMNV